MLLFRVVVTFCVLGFAYQQQGERAKLIRTACEISNNQTVREQFFASVREKHGVTGQYGKEVLYLHCLGGLAGLSEWIVLPIISVRYYLYQHLSGILMVCVPLICVKCIFISKA